MHGIIAKGVRDYVVASCGRRAWRAVQEEADVSPRLYSPTARYPDRHGVELAAAAGEVTGADPRTVEFEVGRHLAPTLVRVYGAHVRGVDSGLDVLADAGGVVREALHRGAPDASAPAVAGERRDDETVVVRYGGAYCAGLRGVVAGLGEYYGERYDVTERDCAGDGADRCVLVVCHAGDGGAGREAVADGQGGRPHAAGDD